MYKKLLVLLVSLMLIFALTGCGQKAQEVGDQVAQSVAQMLSGDVTGEIGKAYSTQWFEFTISSITEVSDYAGYTPAEGHKLYDVLVSEKNIFSEAIPMGTSDFYMDDPDFNDYVYPIDPVDDTMMPIEFELAPGDSAEYHMIYEVPAEHTALVLMYTEINELNAEGATFTIPIQ